MALPSPWFLRPPRPESRLHILTGGCVVPPGRGTPQGPFWLSRALYRVKAFPLDDLPLAERRASLRQLARAWAPFDDAAYRMALRGRAGLVLAWDREQVAGRLAGELAAAGVELWPETLLRPPMAADGLRCVRCLEGVEFQRWHDGLPVLSHWWPGVPTDQDWAVLVRAVGVQQSLPAEPPAVQDPPWLRHPWLDMQGLETDHSPLSRLEVLTLGVAAVGLVTLTAGQAAEAWSLHQQTQQLVDAAARARQAAAPVLAARDRALQTAAAADQLVQVLQAVSPIDVLQHLADVLPAKGVLLKELDLQGQQLRLGLALAPDVQRSAVVRDLQAGGWMTQVTEQREAPGRAWVSFEVRLAALRPPALPLRAAVAASAAKP